MPVLYGVLALALAACTPRADEGQSGGQTPAQIDSIAKLVIPRVERAVGLKFRRPPAIAIRSNAQVRAYLTAKMDQDLPPEELEHITVAYRLFRLIPDTLDLRALLIALYSEQVVGYFDPDSSKLYVVDKADPIQLKLVLAHELVHALQDQYVALDSMLSVRKQNDRRNAAQAVMEGQAVLASIVAMMRPDQDVSQMPEFWNQYSETVRKEQQRMPVFNTSPTIVREGLIFPYLAGADFARWFATQFRDTVPFGPRLPVSTEQILHPDRYRVGDRPVDLRFNRGPKPIYDDNLGEFETRVLLTALSGSETVGSAGALEWGGDRYGIFQAGGGERALVWWTVWDTDAAARRFAQLLAREWPRHAKAGRKYTIESQELATHPGVRLVDAPPSWKAWQSLPSVATDETLPPGFTTPRAIRSAPRPLPQVPKR